MSVYVRGYNNIRFVIPRKSSDTTKPLTQPIIYNNKSSPISKSDDNEHRSDGIRDYRRLVTKRPRDDEIIIQPFKRQRVDATTNIILNRSYAKIVDTIDTMKHCNHMVLNESTNEYERINSRGSVKSYKRVTSVIDDLYGPFDRHNIAKKCSNNINSKYTGLSVSEIESMWDTMTQRGTEMHNLFEICIDTHIRGMRDFFDDVENSERNRLPCWNPNDVKKWASDECDLEFKYLINFLKDHPNLIPIGTEVKMFDDELRVGGTCDVLFVKKEEGSDDLKYVLVDYKRCSKIYNFHQNYKKFWTHEKLSHFPACNLAKYFIQLCFYKRLFENHMGVIVDEMMILNIHPSQKNYELHRVPKCIVDGEFKIITNVLRQQNRTNLP